VEKPVCGVTGGNATTATAERLTTEGSSEATNADDGVLTAQSTQMPSEENSVADRTVSQETTDKNACHGEDAPIVTTAGEAHEESVAAGNTAVHATAARNSRTGSLQGSLQGSLHGSHRGSLQGSAQMSIGSLPGFPSRPVAPVAAPKMGPIGFPKLTQATLTTQMPKPKLITQPLVAPMAFRRFNSSPSNQPPATTLPTAANPSSSPAPPSATLKVVSAPQDEQEKCQQEQKLVDDEVPTAAQALAPEGASDDDK